MRLNAAPDPAAPGCEALPAGVACFADDGALLWCNPELWHLLAMPPDRPPPTRFGALLTPASQVLYQTAVLPRLLDRQSVEESYLSLRMADGRNVPVLANFSRHVPPEGTPRNVAVLVGMRDRKLLDDELLRARRTSEQVPGLICQFLWRRLGSPCFPYASDAIQAMFGITPAQARASARPMARLVPADQRRALRESLQRSAVELSAWHHQFQVRVRGEERWIEGRAAPQRLTDGGVLWHAYLCDVTEHRMLDALARDKAVAERASQAKTEFLARISHELRTPLNAVLGFAQLLSTDTELHLNSEQRGRLSHIESAGHGLLALVNDVLDLTRIEAGVVDLHLQPCELPALLQESLGLVEWMAQHAGVTLHSAPAPALWVLADPHKLSQCLLNLLSNAVKYNRPGGRVDLRVSAQGSQLHITVQDTGPGMTPEQLAHLFEPFNRLGAERSPVEGSGLGLVITRGLVERMGGQLLIRSWPGQGSCFTLQLPALAPHCAELAASEPSNLPAPDALLASPGGAQARIPRRALYVDDNPVNVMLMQAICERRADLHLTVAETGQEALEKAATLTPELLLIDIGLPDMSGIELLARLRAQPALAKAPAVAVSADAMPTDIERALAQGFQAYWTKPLDLQRTLQALDRWLGGQPLVR